MAPQRKCRGLLVVAFLAAQSVGAASYYPLRLDDAKAVYLISPKFWVHADGVADDSDALQQAIDRAQETIHEGIVFIPEGKYRLGKTINVWSGIRLIGYGSQRPVFILGKNTSGFQEGDGKYLLHFVSDRPKKGMPIRDANPGTFYTGMSNIDIEIQDGNPAAVGIRFHVAQHSYLAHIDFRIGSGRAGVEEMGNEAEDLHFFGGEFGITMHKPSPSWPFLLIDSSFEGQRQAAIETEEGGLTIIRNHFKNVPTAIAIREDRAEELWMKDSRLENVSGPALIISDENNARTEINLENVVCARVPVLAAFRESGKMVDGTGQVYQVKMFTHGLHIADLGAVPEIKTTSDIAPLPSLPPLVKSDIPALPAADTWVNIRALGAKGDGRTDDTAVFKEAFAKHRTVYLPSGRYRLTDTLMLNPDTVLVGFHPFATQLVLTDSTPAFVGLGGPVPLLETPKGGSNIVTGIGLDTGQNSRAVAAKWMAGKDSLLNDVRFLGGHGMFNPDGTRLVIYNNNRTGDFDATRHWDSQYWSLWITDGGGGTFKDIWTPNSFAQAGVYISDTATEGRIYALSSEHHVRNEIKLRNVSNWQIYAVQMEEERGESPNCLPVDIDNSSDITFANLYLYRVAGNTPFPYAVKLTSSRDLRFRNVHVYSPGKFTFDNTIFDQTHNAEIRSREIASLNISGKPPQIPPAHESPVLVRGAKVEKLVGGFNNIDGTTVDASGNVYFVDARFERIYRWSPENRDVTLIRDSPLDPVGLVFDKSGDLLVVTRLNKVYSFRPEDKSDEIAVLQPEPAVPRPGLMPVLPINRWRDAHDFIKVNTQPLPLHYLSPDGTIFIPVMKDFVRNTGLIRSFPPTIDLIRAYGLAAAPTNQPFYVADEFGQKTWSFTVLSDGTLANPKLFAKEGEAGIATDTDGNVYVAAGNVFVFDRSGQANRLDRGARAPDQPRVWRQRSPDPFHRRAHFALRGSHKIHWPLKTSESFHVQCYSILSTGPDGGSCQLSLPNRHRPATNVCTVGIPRVYAMLFGIRQSLSSFAVCVLLVFGLFSSWTPPVYAFTNLVFSDEFNGSTTNIDTTKWGFDLGNSSSISGSGWGNGELETYSAAAKNAFVSNGVLHIVALNDVGGGAPYSSARMRTLGKFSPTFGRIEVRAKLPSGSPYWWPAIWMLATNYSGTTGVTNSWPECGEIDMVESKGSTPTSNLSTLHHDSAGNQGVDTPNQVTYTFPAGTGNTNSFHNYVMQWSTGGFNFSVDSNTVHDSNNGTINSWSSSIGAFPTPYNHPFYIIMNLAVGGQFVGSPSTATINAATTFPGDMQIDYIRVYQDTGTQAPLLGVTSVSPTNVCSSGGAVITITGTNFVAGATVTVGGISAGFVTYVSTNTLTVVAPGLSIGAKNVVVTNPDATSSTLVNAINYLSAPASFGGLTSITAAVNGATLTWSAAQGVSPFTYRVYQGTSSGGENFTSPVATVTNLSTFVSLSTAPACANTYFFVVRAADGCSDSESNVVEQSVQPLPTPLVFGGLTNASAIVSGASLSWAAAQGALAPVTYDIYASTSSNIGSLTNLVGQTSNLSGSVSLDPGNNCTNQYFLLVHAVDNCNRVDTNQTVLSVQPVGAPPTFSGLGSITAAINSATLSWATGSGTPPITYNVFQATASGAENFATPLLSTSSLSISVPLYPGSNSPITYFFVVRAQSGCNISESNTVEQSIRPLLDPNGNQNGDGIPNGWKQQYNFDPFDPTVAGADPDGDGMSNLQEYLTGTDPTNSASYFHVLSIAPQGNDILITWMTAGGLTNAVLSASDPGGSYSNISGNIIITGSGVSTTNYLDLGAATNTPLNFYRIQFVP